MNVDPSSTSCLMPGSHMVKKTWMSGQVIAGRYRLGNLLRKGGMGSVWRAEHVSLNSPVALKGIHASELDDEGIKRFLREAQAAAMLRSPHVVQILDHGIDDGVPYIAMELLDGETLWQRMEKARFLSLAQTARIVTHVARAMQKAHDAGIIHRDIKPENIFLVKDDEEEIAKVLDFGVAKLAPHLAERSPKVKTTTGAILGTPYYMSPEQICGTGLDHRTDLWSLAIVAFECACGRLPVEGTNVADLLIRICNTPMPVPSDVGPVDKRFDGWFAKATHRDVAQRFQSAREMADALRTIVP